MKIQTGTRNVKQTVRRFTDEQRDLIVRDIDNRPTGVTKTEMFKKYGMTSTGNLYYVWKNKGYGKTPMNKTMSTNPNVPMNTISINRIVIEVKINSVDDLMKTFDSIKRIKGVKSVSV